MKALAVLLVIELGLRMFLGNVEISDYDTEPTDGRCVALRAGAAVTYTGWYLRVPAVLHATNRLGYRGQERPREKPAGTFRILAVGDSTTYGQGCNAEDAFPAYLEKQLSLRETAIEVLNFGVPGYNIEEYADEYVHLASQWGHDLLLVSLSDNDLDPPLCSMLQYRRTLWWIKNVYLARVLYLLVFNGGFFGDQGEFPVDSSRIELALAKLRDISRERGARIAVVNQPEGWLKRLTGTSVRSIARKLEIPYFDLDSCRLADGGELVEFPKIAGDGHRNAEGNRLAALCIARFLARHDLLRPAASPGGF